MRRRRRRRRTRPIAAPAAALLVAVAAAWVAGFVNFLGQISALPPAPAVTEPADAIVVLTGGAGRLELGLQLLAGGRARTLFISGVDPGVDKRALLQTQQVDAATLECCVALGHSAHDTHGNASETAGWMRAQGYSSLDIVTANYHMPRSLVEFRAALPGVRLTPQPVNPSNVHLDDWWRWPGTVRLLAAEYTKYLATRARILLSA